MPVLGTRIPGKGDRPAENSSSDSSDSSSGSIVDTADTNRQDKECYPGYFM